LFSEKVSHQIVGLELIGDELIATLETLDTPEGIKVKTLIENVPTECQPTGVGYIVDGPTGQSSGIIKEEFRITNVTIVPKD
jgi:hypothetical protein